MTKGLDTLQVLSSSPAHHGMQADGTCDVLGSSSFVVAVEYTLPVVLHILRVDRSNKGTGYAAGSLVVTRVSWEAS